MKLEDRLEEIKKEAVPFLMQFIKDCEEAGLEPDPSDFEEYHGALALCNIEFDSSMDVLNDVTELTKFFENVQVSVDVTYDADEDLYVEDDDEEDYNDSYVEEYITVKYSIKQKD